MPTIGGATLNVPQQEETPTNSADFFTIQDISNNDNLYQGWLSSPRWLMVDNRTPYPLFLQVFPSSSANALALIVDPESAEIVETPWRMASYVLSNLSQLPLPAGAPQGVGTVIETPYGANIIQEAVAAGATLEITGYVFVTASSHPVEISKMGRSKPNPPPSNYTQQVINAGGIQDRSLISTNVPNGTFNSPFTNVLANNPTGTAFTIDLIVAAATSFSTITVPANQPVNLSGEWNYLVIHFTVAGQQVIAQQWVG